MPSPIRLKKCVVSEKFLLQVQKALVGQLDEYELKSVKESTRRYLKKWQNDERERVVFYNPKVDRHGE